MTVTADELIDIYKYFQYCCLPSIIMAKYAYCDYIGDIKKEKSFYRHETKQVINKIGKVLDTLPNKLMDVTYDNVRYMNILGDNIEELFEDEENELHRAIYISFRNARMQPVDCLSALHFIDAMLQIATATYSVCCNDLKKAWHVDVTEVFSVYNLKDLTLRWNEIVKQANILYSDAKLNKKASPVDLNNIRCQKAIHEIRKKISDIETLRIAMRKSYPWSPNFKEDTPFEESADYLIVNSNGNQKQQENQQASYTKAG